MSGSAHGADGGVVVGFVGLGNMGAVLAANLVARDFAVVETDLRGPDAATPGAAFVATVADVARAADVMVWSVPDARASEAVAREVAAVADRRVTHVVDTSTVGLEGARTTDGILTEAGVAFVDAAVSGGAAGARARTLALMYAGPEAACATVEPVLAGMTDRCLRVGERPGLAQVVKLANNFLSATALAATSEAVAFGVAAGLDAATMVRVLDASSGHNTATSDKFPNHVIPGTYASGFTNSLMAKDLALYAASVTAAGTPAEFGALTAGLWRRFADTEPGVDFTRIYPFVEGTGRTEPVVPDASGEDSE